ncbi:MAG: nucleoside hydrolase [Chloroflexota bacterium]
MTIPVIFDTDAGGDIDDLYALALILSHPNLNLVGVTTVSADTQARARVVAKMLRLANRADVPIHAGIRIPPTLLERGISESSYKQYLTHLQLVESGDPEYEQTYNDAVSFILEKLTQATKPITLIGTGPWTNIAEVLRLANKPQKDKIRSITLMGGEIHLLHAESNVFHDPEAADFILKSGLPIFLATWSVSQKLVFSMSEVADLINQTSSTFLRELLRATQMWWEAGVEHKPGPMCYDAIPVFWAAGEREHISCIRLDSIPVELTGEHTRGMMATHPWEIAGAKNTKTTSSEHLTITNALDAKALKQRFIDLVFPT